jgi:hypothetical protein
MERLTLDTGDVDRIRTEVQTAYPSYGDPCPGSALKVDDDVMWLDVFEMRVLWGHDDAAYFNGFSPEWFGETNVVVAGEYVTDRAPADPMETPMPIYPEPMQARAAADAKTTAPKAHKRDEKKALQHVLKQLSPEQAQKARALVKAKRPELLDDKGD